MINLRGRIVPVCDLAQRLGLDVERPDTAKIVIVETAAGTAGVIVDEVQEVLTVEDEQLEPRPPRHRTTWTRSPRSATGSPCSSTSTACSRASRSPPRSAPRDRPPRGRPLPLIAVSHPTPLTTQPIRAVVADDSAFMRKLLADTLAAGGVDVVGTAANGDEALGVCQRLRPDVLTLDLEMPGLDGIGVLRALRDAASPIPVIEQDQPCQVENSNRAEECFRMIFKSKPRPCEITRFAIRWQANFPCIPILLCFEFTRWFWSGAVGCSRHDRA